MRRSCIAILVLAAVLAVAFQPHVAQAGIYNWQGAGTGGNTSINPHDSTTYWLAAGNWSPSGPPGAGDTAYLTLNNAGYVNAQTASVSALHLDGTSTQGALHVTGDTTLTTTSMYVGNGMGTTGRVVHSGGTLAVQQALNVAYNIGSTGAYALSGGALVVGTSASTGYEYIGRYGSGTFTQTGGTNTTGNLYLGQYATANGSYVLGGGTLGVTANEYISFNMGATATFTQTGGLHTAGGILYMGYNSGSTGAYTLGGGTLVVGTSGGTVCEYLGYYGTGNFIQTGGAHTVNGALCLAYSGGTGSFALGGGTLSVTGDEFVGFDGTGTFTQSGGTHSVGGALTVEKAGQFVLSGGSVAANSLTVSPGGHLVASGGTIPGSINMMGQITMAGGTVSTGTVLLNGTAGAEITGSGTLAGAVIGDGNSAITASGGDLAVGDPTSWTGFRTTGTISAGLNTLTLNSRSFIVLSSLTTVEGGRLRAPNGFFLAGGGAVVGAGQVVGPVSSANGSTIQATGSLQLGDSGAYNGVALDGVLDVGSHHVTLNDKNVAVLGSLTTLNGGTLAAANGLFLGEGRNLVGCGTVEGDVSSQGFVSGEGAGVLEFTGNVSGAGEWTGNVVFSGSMSIAASSTMRKTGGGAMIVASPTTYNIESSLVLSGGTTNLDTVGGDNAHRNLDVEVDHATLAAGATQYLASLTMTNSARASLSAVGTGVQSRTIKTDHLVIDGTSRLDIKDNNLVINYTNNNTGSQLQAVIAMIKSGGGTKTDSSHYDWNGTSGITSSSITGNSGTTYTNKYLALGIRDLGFNLVNRPAPASVEGVTVESSTAAGGTASIVVKYTWIGDTDLDGKVTVNDYLEFLNYYANQPAASYRSWMTGDFNYDGAINVNDYLLLLAGYSNQGLPLSGSEEITDTMWQTGLDQVTTPEPATLLLLAAGAGLALARRRR